MRTHRKGRQKKPPAQNKKATGGASRRKEIFMDFLFDEEKAARIARWIAGIFVRGEAPVQYCAATLESWARGRAFGKNALIRAAACRRLGLPAAK